MKNDSNMFPIETPVDDMFDHDKDGKLSGLETMERDAFLYESYKQTSDAFDDLPKNNYSNSRPNNPQFITSVFTNDEDKDYSKPTSDWQMNVGILGTIFLCFGSFALIVSEKVQNDLIKIIILGGAIFLSVCLLKATGVMVSDKKEVKERKKQNRKEFLSKLCSKKVCKRLAIIAFVIITIVLSVASFRKYFELKQLSDNYNYAISCAMNENYGEARTYFNKCDNDYKDLSSWNSLMYGCICFDNNWYYDAYTSVKDLQFDNITNEEREFINNKKEEIENAYLNSHTEINTNRVESTTRTWKDKNTTTTKYYYTTRASSSKKYDPYNAKDYSNEEDFYDDNYDDFYDYYDAEDYYNEYAE